MPGCEECGVYGGTVENRGRGRWLCDKCLRAEKMDAMSDKAILMEYGVGDEIGAFTIVLEGREFTQMMSDPHGDGFKEVGGLRRPGVYLPSKEVRGGTAVQRSNLLLEKVSNQLRQVAERASDDGFHVIGAGKAHDADCYVFIDTSGFDTRDPWFDGDPYIEDTPFKSCTVMGFRLGWWKHREKIASIPYTELYEERGMPKTSA
ncbi:hypothetical protein [Halorubrum depositum]|uniref:hypothetical protein n=1 Tax=Halorubrum depositum TaxID=2583992 RepID=UPI0011A3B628|nr:hypothetical protein [Halorubrum depositum]